MRRLSVALFLVAAIGLLLAAETLPPTFKDFQVRGEVRPDTTGLHLQCPDDSGAGELHA